MKKICVLIAFLLAAEVVSAQSLKPENPYPMKAGINRGTSDSLVGTQYWSFYATPGNNRLKVRFIQPTTLYGTELNNNILSITITDEKRTWRVTKTVSSKPSMSETTFTADKVNKKMKIIVSVAPPNQKLIRMGGDYELEATGDVEFENVNSTTDPIIRTYESKVNSYGATRFLADGTIVTSEGSRGTWEAFDPENRIYTVRIGKFRGSVQYLPGYGLVRPDEPNIIVFQELKR